MVKTNYPSITPMTPNIGQTDIEFVFNVCSFSPVSALSYTIYNEEDPTDIKASGDLDHDISFWPYGVNFSIHITDLEHNSGSYICLLSATNENGTTESTQKCTLEKYIDWAEPESVLAGNRFIANGSEEVGSLPAIDASEITVSGDTVTVPVGVVTQEVTVQAESIDYITLTARVAGSTVTLTKRGTNLATIYYSTDRSNWSQMAQNQTITLENEGDKLYLNGTNPNGVNDTSLVLVGDVTCTGNIVSLLDKSGSVFQFPTYSFTGLFEGSTGLTLAPDLYGIDTSLGCFMRMFKGCTSLKQPPALPAGFTSMDCYYQMFCGCTALETAPALTAPYLYDHCYFEMFVNCQSLKEMPVISATHMGKGSCDSMFAGCTSLKTLKVLPATELEETCYRRMFSGCTSIEEVPYNMLPATELAHMCYYWMFQNCTSLKETPYLPAQTPASACYFGMFDGCSSLDTVTVGLTTATIGTNTPTKQWLRGTSEVGDFYNLGGATFTTGQNGIPSGWTVYTERVSNQEPEE